MHRGRHRAAGDLGVAVRDRDRALLVQAQQHLRLLVAEEIDDAVVQPAIARAGIERNVGNIERAQRLGDDVAAEAGRVGAGWRGTFDGQWRFCSWPGPRHEPGRIWNIDMLLDSALVAGH